MSAATLDPTGMPEKCHLSWPFLHPETAIARFLDSFSEENLARIHT